MCWVREEMWVVMVTLTITMVMYISLGTSSHISDIIINILYISIDQYWIIIWSSVSHVICMWSLYHVIHYSPLSPIGEVVRLSFVIILDFITMETTTSMWLNSCHVIQFMWSVLLGFLGIGVWILRGLVMMSLSLWLLLSIKSLASIRLSKKLQ